VQIFSGERLIHQIYSGTQVSTREVFVSGCDKKHRAWCLLRILQPPSNTGGSKKMLRKSCQIVLAALVLMAVLTPVMQLDSWDEFPVSSDDIEFGVTFCLCILGMGLVFARILKLVPEFLQSSFQVSMPSMTVSSTAEAGRALAGCPLLSTPLRI
jgi:hypothetical protein